MKICYLKNEQLCHQCQSTMQQGEEAVILRMKVQNGLTLPFIFHPQCFTDWNNNVFMYRLTNFRLENPLPKRKSIMGRPRIYRNTALANKLRCRVYYYRKVGNESKVQELQSKLAELRA